MIAELENLYAEKKNNEFPGFLVRKSQNAEKPFSLKQLVEEFKNSCDAPQSTGYWLMRAHKFRSTIHQSEKYDVETKVKLSFALSAKCDEEFLKELRKNAFVTVDGHNRITEYKTKSLELHGVHSKLVTLSVEENRILQYLKGLCMEKGLPLTESWFLKEGEPEDDDKENQPPEAEFFSRISNDSRVEETRRGNEEIFHVDQQEYSLSVEAPDRKKRRGSCPEGSYVAAKSSLKVKEEEKVLKRSKSFPEIKIEEIPLPVREKSSHGKYSNR
uniref:SPK domain-containing protein n=1 Tax=Caenorhabditis tropicalis TaxID=1561998 RepID=A0A1I7SZ94_9PELO